MLTGQQILNASFNDIVFQDRNRSYGAYLLRREYGHHMRMAMGTMVGLCLAAFLFYFFGPFSKMEKAGSFLIPDTELEHFTQPRPDIPLPPLPPIPPAVQQAIHTEVFTPPVIVDVEISPEDMPPDLDVLETAQIGLQKTEGMDIGNVVAPPVEAKGVAAVVAPKNVEDDKTTIYTKVEIPAEFPGGQSEWIRYLQKNLRFPDGAIENGTQGVVRVQFIVDREGNISEVVFLNDPGDGLAEEAVRIIKKGPKWKPAEQNGKKVIYRHTQAITFRIN